MLLLFEPILMYATNTHDFWFDFTIIIRPILGVFLDFYMMGFDLYS